MNGDLEGPRRQENGSPGGLCHSGISEYADPRINLGFSGKDASDFARAVQVSAKRLFGAEKLHFTLLTDYGEAKDARKPTREARKAKPTDVLIIYLAGHGVMAGGWKGITTTWPGRPARRTCPTLP